MDNFDEKTIIQKAMQGDESAFETLILSCSKKAYNIAFRYLRNEEDAQDAVQESFIKLYRHLASFNFNSKFDTWFYRIVVNVCNDILRKRKVQQDTFHPLEYAGDREYHPEIKDKLPTPEERALIEEERRLLLNCIDKLADDHREMIVLRDMNGFSYEEIAEIADCSIGTVKSRISRARMRLRELYIKDAKNEE